MLVIIITLYAVSLIAGLNAIILIRLDHRSRMANRQALRTIQNKPYPVGKFQR